MPWASSAARALPSAVRYSRAAWAVAPLSKAARADEVRALGYPQRFVRLWEYYLAYCEAGFDERYLGTSQIVLHKPGCRLDAAPLIAPIAHAMIDISDGLAPEVNHICNQSGTGASVASRKNRSAAAASSVRMLSVWPEP